MAQTTSVLWSVDQGLGEEEQSQARLNIGAASSTSMHTLKSALNRLSNSVQDLANGLYRFYLMEEARACQTS